MSTNASGHHFYHLTPERILAAIDAIGLETTGVIFQLNSMENRVYEIELYDKETKELKKIVAKFYRPLRWSSDQILEEHQFCFDLALEGIDVVAPLKFKDQSLFEMKGEDELSILFCLFPKRGGRLIADPHPKMLENLGKVIAQVHIKGREKKFQRRLTLNSGQYYQVALDHVLDSKLLPTYLEERYKSYFDELKKYFDELMINDEIFRIHGDFHYGNVLWKDDTPVLFDFDDSLNGPLLQDLWLACPYPQEDKEYWDALYKGYETFSELPNITKEKIEILRATRMIHFNGWIAKRYEDPSFKQIFPHYPTDSYWSGQFEEFSRILELLKSRGQFFWDDGGNGYT